VSDGLLDKKEEEEQREDGRWEYGKIYEDKINR